MTVRAEIDAAAYRAAFFADAEVFQARSHGRYSRDSGLLVL